MRKVCIIGPGFGYDKMFENNDWELTKNMMEADLLQFTGGSDVTAVLYGSHQLPCTRNNVVRDRNEKLIFDWALKAFTPMAGICRGAQFLNVMCGGSMWQDVDKHAIAGMHIVEDVKTGEQFDVTSTHHQMMSPSLSDLNKGIAELVLVAHGRSSKRVKGSRLSAIKSEITSMGEMDDIEAVHYPGHMVFCFQPHPEFHGQDFLARIYMSYLDSYLLS